MAKLTVRWTKQAVADLNAAYDFISADHPESAKQIIEVILGSIDQIKKYPESGRIGRVKGTRELVIVATSFLVVYRKKEMIIEILSILHHSRKWP